MTKYILKTKSTLCYMMFIISVSLPDIKTILNIDKSEVIVGSVCCEQRSLGCVVKGNNKFQIELFISALSFLVLWGNILALSFLLFWRSRFGARF